MFKPSPLEVKLFHYLNNFSFIYHNTFKWLLVSLLKPLFDAKAPSTLIRIFLNAQLFLSGFKNFPVHT